MERYDVAVVGLGALGSAAAYHAALKGAKVLGLEQFEFGHIRGASSDTSRIVRTSYGEPEYVSLARSAYKDWADLERRTGQELLTITGGLVFFPKSINNKMFSVEGFTKSLDVNNVPYELLTHQEVNKRWPQFNLPEGVSAVYTADSGIAHASRSVTAMQYLARQLGAVLKERTPVEAITPSPGGVVIDTPKGQFHAKKVILATDAWTNKLLKPLKAEIPLDIMQEQVTYFRPSDSDLPTFEPSKFPVWIWGDEPCFYGFPSYGEPTIKSGRDTSNNRMTPDQRTFIPSPELFNQLSTFMENVIPRKGQAIRTVTCQYTITPDRQFIISPLEKHGDIILALGAAHGFKFAPAIGRVAAELAIDGKSTNDVSKFGVPNLSAPASKL
ncbi:sarcosine oxidase [Fusarium albosuccineum]|uniref:sarcosine oxidasee (formaldehyde-forming) n=1 Tax=Fusarium albosuccineum TaxID=1237068 RepID=A0A8H4LDK1_9HYPO|nr:sarcosine oxidase [Fusarium albosuccineum]